MKTCGKCEQLNPEEAFFCRQCGTQFAATASPLPWEETELWRAFLGPSKAPLFSLKKGWIWERADEHYLEVFRKFAAGRTPRFAFTWNWPAFLFDPFLWFLYRKMYIYAAIYALGPVLSAYFTGDLSVGIVWRVMAGASANYIYFWHIKEHLGRIRAKPALDPTIRERQLRDEGGVQPYVVWVGIVIHLLVLAMIGSMLQQGPPEGMKAPGGRSLPGIGRTA
jgi:hypothetical protein